MLAVERGSARRMALRLRDRRKGTRCGIGEAARIVRGAEDRVVGDERGVLYRVIHGAIGRMNDPARVEGGRQIVMVARRDRTLEQRIERVAVIEAQPVVGREGHAAIAFDRSDRVAESQRGDQVRPLARRDNHDHRAPSVARYEIAPEQPIDRIAEPRAIRARIKHLCNPAEVGDGTDRNVGQRKPHLAALAADVPPLDRREQREGGIGARQQIPRGQHMVDRIGARAGEHRITDAVVHRIVERGRAVGPAHHAHGDQVGAPLGERVVRQETADREVGNELPRRAHQFLQQLAPLGPAEIERDRLFRAVEIFPIERIIGRGHRPAAEIGAATDLVDADHFGAHLRAIKPGGRGGDEGRSFDHRQAGQQVVHLAPVSPGHRLERPVEAVRHIREDSSGGRPRY